MYLKKCFETHKTLFLNYLGNEMVNETVLRKHPCLVEVDSACCHLFENILHENNTKLIMILIKNSLEATDSMIANSYNTDLRFGRNQFNASELLKSFSAISNDSEFRLERRIMGNWR